MNIDNLKSKSYINLCVSLICFLMLFSHLSIFAGNYLAIKEPVLISNPLDKIHFFCSKPGTVVVKDGINREYLRLKAKSDIYITVAGSLGVHKVLLINRKGTVIDSLVFQVKATTDVDDGGRIAEMFNLIKDGLTDSSKELQQVEWNGKIYRFFVPWMLDNNNTEKGMKYFSPKGGDMVDLFRQTQKDNGMIWSFVNPYKSAGDYYETAYKPINFFRRDSTVWFARQPVENHVEYNYVNLMYQYWKASGNTAWMKTNLESAKRALDYSVTDSVRWSKRFKLLKRPYCIDSWDFQVDDKYTPTTLVSPTMVIVPGKTKYGVFFGDNTGYYDACLQLAEMYDFVGQNNNATILRNRAANIFKQLVSIAWNGKYFTHFIDEDTTVIRDLGVDEKSQIAQGNMYAINRGISHDMSVKIIETYLKLKENLPIGSPGEWYSIYPPFEKGFESHNKKWQYMNGGVAGHAAGELARGAYENGYEQYGTDILVRLFELAKKNGGQIGFSYTGSIPLLPAVCNYKQIDISGIANMSIDGEASGNVFSWMNGKLAGNDLHELPIGKQKFQEIPFNIPDRKKNQNKVAVALSEDSVFPRKTEILINDTAVTVYLLNTTNGKNGGVAGIVTLLYTDKTHYSQALITGKELTGWWLPEINNEFASVAWSGKNQYCARIGVCRTAIINPSPSKKISKLIFQASPDGGIYALLGVTLADKTPYRKPDLVSFGGPSNWASATSMAALVEGLAGVKDDGLAFSTVKLSPRWPTSNTDSVNVTIHYPASNGYITYKYRHYPDRKNIKITVTGSGETVDAHLLLPAGVNKVSSVCSDIQDIPFEMIKNEKSNYVDFKLLLSAEQTVTVKYD